jgi:hypothetical protein
VLCRTHSEISRTLPLNPMAETLGYDIVGVSKGRVVSPPNLWLLLALGCCAGMSAFEQSIVG